MHIPKKSTDASGGLSALAQHSRITSALMQVIVELYVFSGCDADKELGCVMAEALLGIPGTPESSIGHKQEQGSWARQGPHAQMLHRFCRHERCRLEACTIGAS